MYTQSQKTVSDVFVSRLTTLT